MTKDNIKGVFTLVLAGIGYISYVWPAMHAAFNPITFWQKLAMFFTMDVITLIMTVILASAIVEGLNRVYDLLTKGTA